MIESGEDMDLRSLHDQWGKTEMVLEQLVRENAPIEAIDATRRVLLRIQARIFEQTYGLPPLPAEDIVKPWFRALAYAVVGLVAGYVTGLAISVLVR